MLRANLKRLARSSKYLGRRSKEHMVCEADGIRGIRYFCDTVKMDGYLPPLDSAERSRTLRNGMICTFQETLSKFREL